MKLTEFLNTFERLSEVGCMNGIVTCRFPINVPHPHLSDFYSQYQGNGWWKFVPIAQPKRQGVRFHHMQSEIKAGAKKSDPSDSWVSWWLFEGYSDEVISAYLNAHGIEAHSPQCAHDCSGQAFARSPHMHRSFNRVLVRQSGGLDV